MKLLAMIPARLGSKRIPKKNIRILGDKPLIRYAIDLALASNEFDSVWVNSESEALGRIAVGAGVQFHKRPVELSSDTATNRDFTTEFLNTHDCDFLVMVNTTSPLLRMETLKAFCARVRENKHDTILSTLSERAEAFYHGKPLNFNTNEKLNSQELPPIDLVVWALTAWRRDTFLALQNSGKCPIFGGNIGIFDMRKDEACDLDTEEDWRIAEGLMAARCLNKRAQYYDI
ncbi:acylneuraminate cytidylyltransferase family protein [Desulfovibrio sp. OttesenSCG-928-A18]|nr:acylneuraminate cytidylyltransferase family protein [Desulfovibrio sp. OttesenSCG-928-A18]